MPMDLLSSGTSSDSSDGDSCASEKELMEIVPKTRVRNTPHVPGDWHMHVYIPVQATACLFALRDSSLKRGIVPQLMELKPFHWDLHEKFHISLSREFTLKKHQILHLLSTKYSKVNSFNAKK